MNALYAIHALFNIYGSVVAGSGKWGDHPKIIMEKNRRIRLYIRNLLGPAGMPGLEQIPRHAQKS